MYTPKYQAVPANPNGIPAERAQETPPQVMLLCIRVGLILLIMGAIAMTITAICLMCLMHNKMAAFDVERVMLNMNTLSHHAAGALSRMSKLFDNVTDIAGALSEKLDGADGVTIKVSV